MFNLLANKQPSPFIIFVFFSSRVDHHDNVIPENLKRAENMPTSIDNNEIVNPCSDFFDRDLFNNILLIKNPFILKDS